MQRVLVIGHRGAAGLEPENTLRSFRRACDLGVDRIELDVRLTADGHLVCMHDETVDRTTNGTGLVREMTLAQIRRLDAGKGEHVPTLEEAIETIRGRAVLQVELKGEATAVPTLWTLRATGLQPDEVMAICFDVTRLEHLHSMRPELPLALLYGNPPPDAVATALRIGAVGLGLDMRHLTREVIEEAHEAGLEVRAWAPNTREEMERLLDLGVDGMDANRPDLLLDLLRDRGLR